VRLAQAVGLAELVDERLTVPSDKGANAGGKVTALVAGMVAGADSIDDTVLPRDGAMRRIFDQPYAPSTLGRSCAACGSGTSANSTRLRVLRVARIAAYLIRPTSQSLAWICSCSGWHAPVGHSIDCSSPVV
jgi:hypothetical protein